ncbi:MAG TPA: efflux RND transporter permease subunit, partial [Acetobacteraceae bacterium]|nr:efflux RND transporter permease subunit [Acetobacteraceae bacterium]
MRRTDLFIQRPVLAVVVSVFILLLGLRSGLELPVRQFPKTVDTFIEVDTTYYGADADVVAGFITTPLENAIAQVDGIDHMSSQSTNGSSTIVIHLRLNEDPNKAASAIQTQIDSVHDQLPQQSQTPVIHVRTGANGSTLILAFRSTIMSPQELTDYLTRVVLPQMQSVPGVQLAQLWGAQNFALRAWLDPRKLAARGLTAADAYAAMAANNFTSGAGTTTGQATQIPLGITTGLHTDKQFHDLVIRQNNGQIVRLSDVAKVEMGSDSYAQSVLFKGQDGQFIDIEPSPDANVLDVVAGVKKRFEAIQAQLPRGLTADVVFDVSKSVVASIHEVAKTLFASLVIVTLVVFAFLRSVRASIIPVVTIPLSLIGTFGILWAFGFSINLLTLLALVLATGLVVDDAIIVVENVAREMNEGASPLDAALRSARQLASPIVAMTVVLVAVYVPIALRRGLTGALFTEFAMTMVGSVTVSAVLALTLSPMMCRFLLKPRPPGAPRSRQRPLMHRIYLPPLRMALTARPVVVVFGVLVLATSIFLYRGSTSELAPQEDTGFIFGQGAVPATAGIDMIRQYEPAIYAALSSAPEAEQVWQYDQPGAISMGVGLKPWSERHRSTQEVLNDLQAKIYAVTGTSAALLQPPGLPGAYGLAIQYVIKTTRSFDELDGIAARFVQEVLKTGKFAFADRDLKVDLPQADIVLDRSKVAALGLDMAKIGSTVNALLSGGYVNYFNLAGRSYKVIPMVQRQDRLNAAQLANYTIADIDGVPIPLSSVARIVTKTVPEQINHFQQMNDATISAEPAPGVSEAEAKAIMDSIAARILPPDYATDAVGPLRQYIQESSGFASTFGMALIVIYLALAALFGSFRDPLIILVSVPMSLAGALIFIYFGVHGATLNIYTEVGLVTLMGLISKHGILMVEVANEQQALGQTKRQAIEHAAVLRLRPILMTTGAMVLGVVPLVLATGAGAAARFAMGLVIASGLSIGTLFTL